MVTRKPFRINDYIILLSAVSQESTSKLQRLLEEKVSDNDKFLSDVHAIIASERKKQLDMEQQRKDTAEQHSRDEEEKQNLKKINKELSDKLDAISQQITDIQNTARNETKRRNEKEKKDRIHHFIVYSIFIAIIITLGIIIFQKTIDIIAWLNSILNIIKSLGGVWTFIGLLITIISKLRNK